MAKLENKIDWDEWKFDGHIVYPPNRQLAPKEYQDAKKELSNNLGKWCGGKKQHFEFPFDVTHLGKQMRAGERPSIKRDLHYFPTTTTAAETLFNCIMPLEPSTVLEPSAGQGAILKEWKEWCPHAHDNSDIECVEMHDGNVTHLKKAGYNVVGSNFDEFNTDKRYELILSNPPFNRAVAHVRRMASLIAGNGIMGIILPSNFGNSKKEKELIDELESQFDSVQQHSIPEGAFKESGTAVDTKVLYCMYSSFVGKGPQ